MANRYLLFAGSNYYPEGGWDDLHTDSDYLDSLVGIGENLILTDNLREAQDWFHIVDTVRGEIVVYGTRSYA